MLGARRADLCGLRAAVEQRQAQGQRGLPGTAAQPAALQRGIVAPARPDPRRHRQRGSSRPLALDARGLGRGGACPCGPQLRMLALDRFQPLRHLLRHFAGRAGRRSVRRRRRQPPDGAGRRAKPPGQTALGQRQRLLGLQPGEPGLLQRQPGLDHVGMVGAVGAAVAQARLALQLSQPQLQVAPQPQPLAVVEHGPVRLGRLDQHGLHHRVMAGGGLDQLLPCRVLRCLALAAVEQQPVEFQRDRAAAPACIGPGARLPAQIEPGAQHRSACGLLELFACGLGLQQRGALAGARIVAERAAHRLGQREQAARCRQRAGLRRRHQAEGHRCRRQTCADRSGKARRGQGEHQREGHGRADKSQRTHPVTSRSSQTRRWRGLLPRPLLPVKVTRRSSW